uniref:Tyr recombinase domain-containing protein n=1 Tax=Magallana gigas TaxID=29159 RepID=A0A8W8MU17_MAGGI
MVPAAAAPSRRSLLSSTKNRTPVEAAERSEAATSLDQDEDGCVQFVRQCLHGRELSADTINIICGSWRESTKRQYRGYQQKWLQFCCEKQSDPFNADINLVLDFLTELYKKNLGYSALNTARSSLSSFLSLSGQSNTKLGDHFLVKRFMKGVFLSRPTLPKYQFTWDVNKVLGFLKTLSPVQDLSLLDLSKKLAMLFALLSGQRKQSLHLLDVRNVSVRDDMLIIRYGDLLKQSKPGHHLDEICIAAYPNDVDLCIVNVYMEYVQRTMKLRGSGSRLFISTQKPHNSVSVDTIGRWIKGIMKSAGIDIKCFAPHSTRSAATSAAANAKLSVDTILRTAGWTSDNTFRKFYNKPVNLCSDFSNALLDSFHKA